MNACLSVYVLLVLLVFHGGVFSSGKSIGSDSGVTFYGKVADRIFNLLFSKNQQLSNAGCTTIKPSDCGELNKIFCPTGIYTIYSDDTNGFDVFCEMKKDGGGWTVFQHRQNGLVNFYRNWAAYKQGFGSLSEEFWLGNDHINQIASQGSYTLRVDLADFDNNYKYAKYLKFPVGPESSGYKLEVSGYSGDAGDSMQRHNNNKFSTKDRDNDKRSSNCALLYKGGWWYADCHHSNLNGQYFKGVHASHADGVNWYHWRGFNYSLKATTMMMRRTKLF